MICVLIALYLICVDLCCSVRSLSVLFVVVLRGCSAVVFTLVCFECAALCFQVLYCVCVVVFDAVDFYDMHCYDVCGCDCLVLLLLVCVDVLFCVVC